MATKLFLALLNVAATLTLIHCYSPFKKVTVANHGSHSFVNDVADLSAVFPYLKERDISNFNGMPTPPSLSSGNPFEIVYQWKILDFQYDSLDERQRAISSGAFVPENNLPLGVDRWRDRLFITMPRWKNGVPASLSWLPLPAVEPSPPMIPYPSLAHHADPLAPDCTKLMSVYRIWVDECARLWVLDAGIVNATIKINPVCPPKVVAFDLHTDRMVYSYELPDDQVKQDSLHSNIVVDIRHGQCSEAYVYVTDVWRNGIVVISLAAGRSWRTTNHLYLPNPMASDFTLKGINFQWTDGVFGLSLTPVNEYNDRLMFFHPMSSFTVCEMTIERNEWNIS